MSLAAAGERRSFGLVVILAITVLCTGLAFAALTFPVLTGRVIDEAGLLTSAERQSLTDMLAAYEQKTTNQVVVVTLKSLQGTSIEDYGYQLGRHWGIGQKGKDNGALLIVAPNERKVRIEVGYGLEGELTDAASKLIIENIIVPAFKSGQFGPGIVAGTGAILKVLSGEQAVPATRTPLRLVDREQRPLSAVWIVVLLIGMVGAFALLCLLSDGGFDDRRFDGDYGGGGDFGGGFGGGFGSGGFGGGGGGFGGGGASGSW
jgi:uncharacterized protein